MSCVTMKTDRKASVGKLCNSFISAEDSLQAPPLQWGHRGHMKVIPLEERSPLLLP